MWPRPVPAARPLARLLLLGLGARAGALQVGGVGAEGEGALRLVLSGVGRRDATYDIGTADGANLEGSAGNATPWMPSLFCFTVVRPIPLEIDLLRVQLKKPMLSGCDAYAVYSNVSLDVLVGPDATEMVDGGRAVRGNMDVGWEGWPAEKPIVHSASNSPIFRQVWLQIWNTGTYRRHDWTVKLDPDTVFLPGRVRWLLRDHPDPGTAGVFDSGGLCKTSMGGIAILSREAVNAIFRNAAVFLALNVEREDALLVGAVRIWGQALPEPNLLLNPVPAMDCSSAPWKAVYHPMKHPFLLTKCFMQAQARQNTLPSPEDIHTKCLV